MVQVNVGKGIDIAVDFGKLPQAAIDHILYIGARNILMDSHASITADEYPDATTRTEVARSMVEKKLAALMSGEVRVASTREGDPVMAEARRMALAIVVVKIKKAGKKPGDYEKAALKQAADKLMTAELLTQAKARVDQTRAAGQDTELADLGL